MRQPPVLVVTSCTGEKRYKPKNQLTLEDFKDSAQLQKRSCELAEFACPAGEMYTGVQHLRTMEGVQLLRQSLGREAVDLVILSAGYGLIPEEFCSKGLLNALQKKGRFYRRLMTSQKSLSRL